MAATYTNRGLGGLVYLACAFLFGAYFTFAAVQGDYGMFRRVAINAEAGCAFYDPAQSFFVCATEVLIYERLEP